MSEEQKSKRNYLDFPIIFAIAVVGILLFVMNLVNQTIQPIPSKNDTNQVIEDSLQVDSLRNDTLK